MELRDREILFGLHQLSGVGWKTIVRILQCVRPLSAIFELSTSDLEVMGIEPFRAKYIFPILTPEFVREKLDLYRMKNVYWFTQLDEEYPELLGQITDEPPWVLYYMGDVSLLQKPLIAVVGSRTPTVYGRKVAKDFAEQLCYAGFSIVSGMARGVDSEAHEGAMKAKGRTIAVTGTGFDHVYPRENLGLFRRIVEHGAVLSEVPLGMGIHKGMFRERNRIIAGISCGTLVVEAADGSGALNTLRRAVDYGRGTYAIPGPISSPKSFGPMREIKEGRATLVTEVADILKDLQHLRLDLEAYSGVHEQFRLSKDERRVLAMLKVQPLTIDSIIEETGFDFGHLHSILLSLTLKHLVEQLPGSIYTVS